MKITGETTLAELQREMEMHGVKNLSITREQGQGFSACLRDERGVRATLSILSKSVDGALDDAFESHA